MKTPGAKNPSLRDEEAVKQESLAIEKNKIFRIFSSY